MKTFFPMGPPTPTIAPPGPANTSQVRKNVWYCPCGALFDVKQELDDHVGSGCPLHPWWSVN